MPFNTFQRSELRSMASSSSPPQPKDENHAFSGIEPEGIRRRVSESTTLYDVFINHRGPDSKYSLALPLYTSLKELGIRAFLDLEEMELGQSFPSTIETAIRSAGVHIAIFSKRYAESPWCLAELLLMLQSPAKIIPVFYGVEPWALRHVEKGVYADAFIQYERKSRYLDQLKQWKEALQSISFTTGYEINNSNIGDHKSILSAVQREVQRIKPLHVAKYPVALDKLVQEFERRCLHNLVQDFEIHCGMNKEEDRKAKIVGLFGMGGVGKTTLSKELFNRKRQQYDRACFLFDVRDSSVRCNLPSLQMKFLEDLFGEKNHSFQSTEEGLSCISSCIKRRSSLSFLIVLDDIDQLKQLDDFSIMDILEKPGNSLLIITTRDVGILIAEGINVGYHLKGMDKDDARQLFSWHAFSQPHPARGYEELVDDFLGVCGGLPLSLQVVGRHVHGRDENYWRSELQKLGTTMHRDIRKSLKLSFDALDTEEKQIFMDVACFFVDQLKCIAISVWKASGWSAESGLQALKDKCLVEEIEDPVPVLRMHDHLRDLGREIANELSQPRRLWHPRELKKLELKGFENIIAQTKERCFYWFFDKFLNSRVKFFLGESNDSAEMSSCLLWLHLCYPYQYSHNLNQGHPQPGIPSWIPLQNMQCLRISNGYLKRLWQHDAEASSELKKLEIYGTFLLEYPDFFGILTHVEQKVEKEVEKKVNDGQHRSKMKSFISKTCRRLSGSLPTTSVKESSSLNVPLNSNTKSATLKAPLSLLEDLVIKEQENIKKIVLNGNYCPSLRSLELSSVRNLIEMQFTRVETLNCLNISKCQYLKILSVTSDLTELEELSISECPVLEEPNLGHLSCLKKIRIADCNMNSVPGMSSFKMLVELNVSRCPKLHELCLAHLGRLEKLMVHHCDHLESVTGLSHLLNLVEVSISWCSILQLHLCLVNMNRLKRITVDRSVKVKCFELKDCKDLETVSGISFKKIRVLNICGCPELKNLPVICAPSCLEVIIINGCWKLDYLALTGCGILKRVSGNLDLVGLSISDCPMLQELPSLGCLIHLEEIRILQCGNLQNITLPTTITKLTLQKCRNLQVEGMSNLTKLTELNISECPEIEEFPVFCGLSCLEKITIDGYRKLNYLHMIDCAMLKVVGYNFDMCHLAQLLISDCPELEELPCLTRLNCLEEVRIVRCKKLQKLSLPKTLKYLQLDSCKELKSVSEISRLKNLVELIISGCEQLVLELCLEVINSLQSITFDGSRKLKSFLLNKCENLKRVSGNFDVERISICGCPELEELSIPDCSGLSCLKEINIESCDKLQNITLPSKLTNLTNFIVQNCRHLQRITGIDDLSKLTDLCIRECPEIELPILPELSCLERISVNYCEKLHKIILPVSVLKISVQWCRKLQTVAAVGDLSKLTDLHITKCADLEELPVLFGLRSLQSITIDGCGKLNLLKVFDCEPICEGLPCSFDPGHLAQLWISDRPELDELPCLAHLTCLQGIGIVRCMKLQKITLPLTLKNLHLDSCKELRSVSEISRLTNLVELIISQCGQLELELRLEDMDSLQTIATDGCAKIKSFQLNKHQYLKRLSGHFDVEWISICGCDELEELSICDCPGQSCLEKINIESCAKLRNITLPTKLTKLTNLVVQGCKHLQRIVGIDDLTALTYLYISKCPQLEELPNPAGLSFLERITIESCDNLHSLTLPTTLIKVRLQWCRNLQVAGVSDLTKLTELHISECALFEEMFVVRGLSWLERITIDGCVKISYLEVIDCAILKTVRGNLDMAYLAQLMVSDCPKLEELPSFARLIFLVEIRISRCRKLQKVTLPRTLKNLQLDSCPELKTVSEISHLKNLVELIISQCGQLELELHLEDMDSLRTIASDGCGKIKSFGLNRCQNLQRLSAGNLGVEWVSICGCPELQELSISDCPGLDCLKKLNIESCDKLQNITLPAELTNLIVQRCRHLQRITGMGDLSKLTELHISKCPDLEELSGLNSLESITIDGCGKLNSLNLADCGMSEGVSCSFDLGHLVQLWISDCPALEELACFAHLTCLQRISIIRSTKLQKIALPITLKYLHLDSCKELRQVSKMGRLSKLTELYISECPLIEELPILGGQSCLERITIYSCEKLHKITLPTTLRKFTVQWCRKLQTVAAMGYLSMLTDMCIGECPELDELPNLAGLSCLESIKIDSCERLHNLTLPTTLIKLRVRRCRELPILGRLSCLKSIVIESCERLENIQGIKKLEALEVIQFLYCSTAAVQDCISKLEHVPSNFIQVVGRAADRATSNLNLSLLPQAYFPHLDISSRSGIFIICLVVVVSSSASPHTINENSPWKLDLPQGEWVITTIINSNLYHGIPSMGGITKTWCAWCVRNKNWRICYALTEIADKLHQN